MTALRISSFLTAGSGVVRLLAGFVSAPLLVQLLGAHDFGILAVTTAIVTFAGVLEFGLSAALTNELSRESARGNWVEASRTGVTSLFMITLAGIGITVSLFIFAPRLTEWLFPVEVERRAGLLTLQAMSLILLPRFWQLWAMAAEASLCRYDLQTLIELPFGLAIQIGSAVIALAGLGPAGVAGWQVLVTIAACVGHWYAISRAWPSFHFEWKFCASIAARLLKFGLAQQANTLGTVLFNQGDRIIVNGLLGPTAAGLYAAAIAIASKIHEIPYMVFRVIPPAVASASALNDFGRLSKLYRQAVYANGMITLAVTVLLLCGAEPISRLMVGASLGGTEIPLLRTVVFIYGAYSICMPSIWFGLGLGHPGILARWTVIGGVLMCLAMSVGSQLFGLIGAAWGNAAYLAIALITFEIAPMMRLSRRAPARAFFRLIAGLTVAWLVCSSSMYNSLPPSGQLLTAVVLAPSVLLLGVPVSELREICETATGTIMAILHSGRALVINQEQP